MSAQKTMIEAERVPVAVAVTASPGDYLLVVGGVCVGVEGIPDGPDGAPRLSFTTSKRLLRKEETVHAKYLVDDLLYTLYELKDPTPTKRVLGKIEPRIASKLKPLDYEKLKGGELRWRNKVHWARFLAVNAGLMKKNSEHGMWELSDDGRRHVEEMRRNSGGR
jgi:hypothetical protein